MRKVESRQQGPPAKKAKLQTRYWRRIVGLTWWVNIWKRNKNANIIRWLSFSFFGRKWISIFRFRFVFGHKWNFIFVSIFVYGRKWKMLFGRPPVYIHHKKVLVLVLRCKVLVLVLNTRLGLGLGLEKVLITSLLRCEHSASSPIQYIIITTFA